MLTWTRSTAQRAHEQQRWYDAGNVGEYDASDNCFYVWPWRGASLGIQQGILVRLVEP